MYLYICIYNYDDPAFVGLVHFVNQLSKIAQRVVNDIDLWAKTAKHIISQ
jgi:hypothetical protein